MSNIVNETPLRTRKEESGRLVLFPISTIERIYKNLQERRFGLFTVMKL